MGRPMTDHDERAVITARGLSKRFGQVTALRDLNLEVRAGEIFGMLGHNGAGKTTTVRLCNGVLAPDHGGLEVLGLSPLEDGPALRRRTGVLTETPSLEERLSGRENLTIYAELFQVPPGRVRSQVEGLLERFELAERGVERVARYSKGMRQRLALARALIHEPELLFLDEPTAGLDPVAARQVHELILRLSREEGRTVFICTHNLIEAQRLCHRVAVLEEGRLVAVGAPEALAGEWVRAGTLEIEVEADQREAALAVLAAMPALRARAGEAAGIIWIESASREAVPELIQGLVTAGVRLYRVVPRQATLEDVYFALHDPAQTEAST